MEQPDVIVNGSAVEPSRTLTLKYRKWVVPPEFQNSVSPPLLAQFEVLETGSRVVIPYDYVLTGLEKMKAGERSGYSPATSEHFERALWTYEAASQRERERQRAAGAKEVAGAKHKEAEIASPS